MIPVLCSWLMILYSLFFVSPEQAMAGARVGEPMDLVPYSFEFVPGSNPTGRYVKGVIFDWSTFSSAGDLLHISNGSGDTVNGVVNSVLFPAGQAPLVAGKRYIVGFIMNTSGLFMKKYSYTPSQVKNSANNSYDTPTGPFVNQGVGNNIKLALRVKNKNGQVILGPKEFNYSLSDYGCNPIQFFCNTNGDICGQ